MTQDLYQQVMNVIEPGDGRLPKRNITWLEALGFLQSTECLRGVAGMLSNSGR